MLNMNKTALSLGQTHFSNNSIDIYTIRGALILARHFNNYSKDIYTIRDALILARHISTSKAQLSNCTSTRGTMILGGTNFNGYSTDSQFNINNREYASWTDTYLCLQHRYLKLILTIANMLLVWIHFDAYSTYIQT